MRQVSPFQKGLLAQMFSYFQVFEIFFITRSFIQKPLSALFSQIIGKKNSGSSIELTFCFNASVEFQKAQGLFRQSFTRLAETPLMPTTYGFYSIFLPVSQDLFSLIYFFSSYYLLPTFLTVLFVTYYFYFSFALSSTFELSTFLNFYSYFCLASILSFICYFFSSQNCGQMSQSSSRQKAIIQLISKNSFPFYNSFLPSTLCRIFKPLQKATRMSSYLRLSFRVMALNSAWVLVRLRRSYWILLFFFGNRDELGYGWVSQLSKSS